MFICFSALSKSYFMAHHESSRIITQHITHSNVTNKHLPRLISIYKQLKQENYIIIILVVIIAFDEVFSYLKITHLNVSSQIHLFNSTITTHFRDKRSMKIFNVLSYLSKYKIKHYKKKKEN